MSFLERAKQAAEQARHAAGETAREVAEKARAEAPGAAEKAREAAGKARHTLVTAIERIDPGLLADVVIKATALQERANAALRAKESAYRIDEITVTATIPPQIGFTISRVGDPVESGAAATAVDSATLIESGALAASPDVVADLDASAPEPEVG